MVHSEAKRGESILNRCGKAVLRGAPVVDGKDRRASVLRKEPAGVVVRLEIAHDEATTVEVDEQTAAERTIGSYIQTGTQRTVRAVDRDVLDAADHALWPLEGPSVCDHLSASFRHAQRVKRWRAAQLEELQTELRLDVQLLAVDHNRPTDHHPQQAIGQACQRPHQKRLAAGAHPRSRRHESILRLPRATGLEATHAILPHR